MPDQGKGSSHVYCQHSTGNITNESMSPSMHKALPHQPLCTCGSPFRAGGAEQADGKGTGCPAWMHLGTNSVKGSFTDGPSANFSTNDQQLSTEQGCALQSCPCWTLQLVFWHIRSGSVGTRWGYPTSAPELGGSVGTAGLGLCDTRQLVG